MQCQVIAVGRPSRRVRNAASTANGLTTPMCTWATSNVASRSRMVNGANGFTGRSQGSLSAIRCTVIPSTSSVAPCRSPCVPGVAREHLHVVSAAVSSRSEVVDLYLDAAQPRQVAVREQGDLHGSEDVMGQNGDHMGRTLVAFHAHPDDEALLTSGTMARAAAEGHRVVLVVATDGGLGLAASEYVGASDTTLGSVRMAELHTQRARRSARLASRRSGMRTVGTVPRSTPTRPAGCGSPAPTPRRRPDGSPRSCARSRPTCCSPTTPTAVTGTATT